MIHYNYIDPAQAKPGDYMVQEGQHSTLLSVCIQTKDYDNQDGNHWYDFFRFRHDEYPEIINGKPTPALIARFTGNSGKRFRHKAIHDIDFVKTAGGIVVVDEISKGYNGKGYMFKVHLPYFWDDGKSYIFTDDSYESLERERARLIEWLEGA